MLMLMLRNFIVDFYLLDLFRNTYFFVLFTFLSVSQICSCVKLPPFIYNLLCSFCMWTLMLFVFVSLFHSSCRAPSSSTSPLLLSPRDLLRLSLHFSVYSVVPTSMFFWMPMHFVSLHCVLSVSLSLSLLSLSLSRYLSHLIDKSLPCLFERKTDSHSSAPCISFSPSSLHSCLSFWDPL